MSLSTFIVIFIIVFFAMIPISMLVEAMRPKRDEPSGLYWSDSIPVQHCDLNGTKVRYIKTGEGPALVLLHTLRTQLDFFHKIIPELSKSYTVYAVEYPGHGWSEIPDTDYTMDMFVRSVESFFEKLELNDVILAGVSIGGAIPLVMAGKKNPRLKAVVSINP